MDPRNKTLCSRGISMEVQATSRSYVGLSMTVRPKNYVEEPTLRRRSRQAIQRLGSPIQVIRDGQVVGNTYAILSPLQRISSPKTLSIIRESWFIPGDDIQGGDYIYDMNHSQYYLFLAQNEYAVDGEYVGTRSIVARCNRVATIYRLIDKPTGAGGVRQEFEEVERNVPISIEFIKAGLRMEQPGFFENSTHRAFVPAYLGLESMDRVKVMDTLLRVDTMDKISFDNTVQISFSKDDRDGS